MADDGERDPGTLAAPDPVALHGLDLLRPVHAVEVVGQAVGVGGDAHHPLAQVGLEDGVVAALGPAVVGDLLVGQHGPQAGGPVHRRLRGVGQPEVVQHARALHRCERRPVRAPGDGAHARYELLHELVDRTGPTHSPVGPHGLGVVPGVEDLQEDPLRPLVVARVDRRDRAAVVVAQPQPAQLALHDDHVVLGRLARVLTGLHGVLLGGQAERVVTQAVQDVLARHPVVAREHVGRDVAQGVPDVQSGSAGVGEHVEDEQLLAVGHLLGLGPGTGRVGRVEGAFLLPAVLPGQLDLLGHLGGVAVRRLAHLILVSCRVWRTGAVLAAGGPPNRGYSRQSPSQRRGWPRRPRWSGGRRGYRRRSCRAMGLG